MISPRAPVQRAPLYNLAIGRSFSGLVSRSGCAAFGSASQNGPSDHATGEVCE